MYAHTHTSLAEGIDRPSLYIHKNIHTYYPYTYIAALPLTEGIDGALVLDLSTGAP